MNKIFDVYSSYYNLFYKEKDYGAEAKYVANLIKEHTPEAKTILELGCGTGAHAEHLAKMGFIIHGIDRSETMLSQAQIRKAELSYEIAKGMTFKSGDVRTYRVLQNFNKIKTFDVVLSLFHVFSYQTTNDDLQATFQTAAAHLKPGGILIFDFWYGPAVLTQRPEVRIKRLEDDKIRVTRIAEPVMHVNENVVDVNYTVFIEDKATKSVETIKETHKMRYYFLPEIYIFLADSNFKILHTNEWMRHNTPLSQYSWNVFIVGEKHDLSMRIKG